MCSIMSWCQIQAHFSWSVKVPRILSQLASKSCQIWLHWLSWSLYDCRAWCSFLMNRNGAIAVQLSALCNHSCSENKISNNNNLGLFLFFFFFFQKFKCFVLNNIKLIRFQSKQIHWQQQQQSIIATIWRHLLSFIKKISDAFFFLHIMYIFCWCWFYSLFLCLSCARSRSSSNACIVSASKPPANCK